MVNAAIASAVEAVVALVVKAVIASVVEAVEMEVLHSQSQTNSYYVMSCYQKTDSQNCSVRQSSVPEEIHRHLQQLRMFSEEG